MSLWFYVEQRKPDTPRVAMTLFSTRALAHAFSHECDDETCVHEIEAGSEDMARLKLVAQHVARERDIDFHDGYSWAKRSGRLANGRHSKGRSAARR